MIASAILVALLAVGVVKSETTLTCEDDKMVVEFDSAQNVESYSLQGTSGDSNCNPDKTSTRIAFSLQDCGTTVTNNNTHIIYENTLTGAGSSMPLISRGAMLKLVLKCSYEREGTTTVLSWTAGQSIINIDGEGTFEFDMYVYDDFTGKVFGTPLTSPFTVDLREKLYFKIELNADDNLGLVLQTKHIIATDKSDITATTKNKYYIVEDFCKKDSTYSPITPTTNKDQFESFEIEAFNFLSNPSAPVYIHGVMTICRTDEANFNTCTQGCVTGVRRRRDTELYSENQEREFNIYGGPFLFNDPESKEIDDLSDGYKSHVSAFILVLGQAALLLINY